MNTKITVQELVNEIKEKKIMNTKLNEHALEDFLRERLEVKEYVPFNEKRQIVEMVVQGNMTEVDGIKKIDSVSQYIGFVIAMLVAHTSLEVSENPVEDYDLLAQSGILNQILGLFSKDVDDCNILLKMIADEELSENTTPVIIAKFLGDVSQKLGDLFDAIKEKAEEFDIEEIIKRANISDENLDLIKGLLNK